MSDDVDQITVDALAARMKDQPDASKQDFMLLDVREDWERQIAAIEPAMCVVMNDVPERLASIREALGERELIVFCHSGGRSMVIARFLLDSKFTRVTNLTGGIDAWSQHFQASEHLY